MTNEEIMLDGDLQDHDFVEFGGDQVKAIVNVIRAARNILTNEHDAYAQADLGHAFDKFDSMEFKE